VGSIFCWWPVIMQPSLSLPVWKTPLVTLALIVAFATALPSKRTEWLIGASMLGAVAGVCCGLRLWRPIDLNDAPYVLTVGLASLVSIPVSVIAAVVGVTLRESKFARKNRRLTWCLFLSSFVLAPTVVALTPWLMARRR
jgi:ethanolamine transporter EutH